MAEESNGMSAEDKRLATDTVIKVGLIYLGYRMLTGAIDTVTGSGGSTDRVEFDLANTQQRCMVFGSDSQGNPQIECEPDPWTPADISRRFGEVVRGWTGHWGSHVDMYQEIRRLGYDRARWFHNYWLDTEDSKDTVYRWIRGEAPNELSPEGEEQELTEKQLIEWGIGF